MVLLMGTMVFAEPGQDILRQQNQIIQHEEQRRRAREDELRERRELPPEPVAPSVQPQKDIKGDEAICFQVTEISIDGVTLLSDSALQDISKPYLNRCLTLGDMNALVRDITNAYVERGYVAARAYLPEQDISTGILRIAVIEGTVEGILLNDGTGKQQNQLITAFPGLRGKPLMLRDLEQGLDQMNRLPSNNARMKLEPGATPGGSVVRIENAPQKSWRFNAGLANSGQKSTGRDQATLSFEKDNFIGLNDQLSLYRSADAASVDGDSPRSQSLSAYWSVPYGYWTMYGSLNTYTYSSELSGHGTSYTSSGETITSSLGLDRVVHRDSKSKSIAGASVTTREVANYIEDTKLTLSSYNLCTGTFRLQHSRRMGQATGSAGVEYHHGFSAMGAERNPDQYSGMPDTVYDRYVGTASLSLPLPPDEEHLALRSSVYAQWSPDTLYGAEQVVVGGLYSVRGFHDESVSGNMGGYWRNEITWSQALPQLPVQALNRLLSTMQPYVFYDAGYVHPQQDRDLDKGMLQGAGVGMRLRGEFASVEFMTGKALDRPASVKDDDWTSYLSVTLTF